MLTIIEELMLGLPYPAVGQDDIGRQGHYGGPQVDGNGGGRRMNDYGITLRRGDISELASKRPHRVAVAIAV